MAEYSNSIFTLTGRRQLKKVFKNNMYPNGYKIKFFIMGTGGTDSNNIPKIVDRTKERLECEGEIRNNISVSFTQGQNTAILNSGTLSVGDYIRPNFSYDILINLGEIIWFRIEGINGNTLTLNKQYNYQSYSGIICKNTSDLYGFVKMIQDTDIDVNVPGDDYCAKVRIFLDYGDGNGYDYSECGLYDIENKLIAYANFPRVTKTGGGQLTRYFNLRV
jgi:hypothetical protein